MIIIDPSPSADHQRLEMNRFKPGDWIRVHVVANSPQNGIPCILDKIELAGIFVSNEIRSGVITNIQGYWPYWMLISIDLIDENQAMIEMLASGAV